MVLLRPLAGLCQYKNMFDFKKNRKIIDNKRAFTLVEVLLYMSIVSVLILIMSAFLFLLLQGKTKFSIISEVNDQGLRATQTIAQTIREANSITLPAQGANGQVLTLAMTDGAKDPTVIDSGGTNLQIKEGLGATTPITNSRVVVSNLSFTNVSRPNSPGTVMVQFTISADNQSGRNEYDFSQDFYVSVSLR